MTSKSKNLEELLNSKLESLLEKKIEKIDISSYALTKEEQNSYENGKKAYKTREYDKSVNIFEDLIKTNRDFKPAQYHLCLAYLKKGDKENARRILQLLINDDTFEIKDPEPRKLDNSSQIKLLQESINELPTSEKYAKLANFFMYKDSEKGFEAAKKSVELDETNSKAHAALCHYRSIIKYRNLNEAIKSGKKGIELNKKCEDSYRNLATAYHFNNNIEESIRTLTEGILNNPNSAELYLERAYINESYSKKNFISAESDYKKVLELLPRFQYIKKQLSYVCLEQGKYDEAIKHIKEFISKNKTDANAYHHLGNCYFEKKNYDNANQNYAKALAIMPTHSRALNGFEKTIGLMEDE